MNDLPDDLIRRLRGVRSIGAITGAGVSAESGIQTYRGKGGIWAEYDYTESFVIKFIECPILSGWDRV